MFRKPGEKDRGMVFFGGRAIWVSGGVPQGNKLIINEISLGKIIEMLFCLDRRLQ